MSGFYGKCGGAGLISSSQILMVKVLENLDKDEEGFISHLKIEEKCDIDVFWGWLPWGDEAFPFHGPVNWGETGENRSEIKVELD